MIIYNINNFDYEIFKNAEIIKASKGRPISKLKFKYKNLYCSFDIETSKLKDQDHSFMYIWQVAIEDKVIVGRYWHEFIYFIDKICMMLDEDEYIVFFVSNLSYEFSFLKGIYKFSNDEVFAIDRRKVLTCRMNKHIEFRCSYYQTNMSLEVLTYKYNVEHKKLDDFEYTKIRYPWTKLTTREMEYAVNDVLGLVEAMKERNNFYNDNLLSMPLTSTGYVRRECKYAMYSFNHMQLKNMLPNLTIYDMLTEAFRGGNTHANRYYANQTLKLVTSADISSSYPNEEVNSKVPMSEFYLEETPVTMDWVLDLIYKYKKAVLFRIALWDVELQDHLCGCPYLPRDKCRKVIGGQFDNGRILSAKYLETTLTDKDFKIILSQYKWSNVEPLEVASASYGYMPKQIRDLNIKYYKAKTELKGLKDQQVHYDNAKAMLNSIYGMSVTKVIREPVLFINNDFEIDHNIDRQALLDKSYKKAFLNYAWGVWVTANARTSLQEAIDMLGYDFVYCDTDSVYYLGKHDFKDINDKKIKMSKSTGAYAKDKHGKIHYMGVFESEGTKKEFKTLGAKKYAYIDSDDELHLTLAGVNKKLGAEELQSKGGLNAFKEGMIFVKAGGNEAVYNDNINFNIKIGKHDLNITDNLCLKPSTYTLSLTDEYIRLLEDSEVWVEFLNEERSKYANN